MKLKSNKRLKSKTCTQKRHHFPADRMPFLTPEKYMRGKAKSGVENETRWNESQLGQIHRC